MASIPVRSAVIDRYVKVSITSCFCTHIIRVSESALCAFDDGSLAHWIRELSDFFMCSTVE